MFCDQSLEPNQFKRRNTAVFHNENLSSSDESGNISTNALARHDKRIRVQKTNANVFHMVAKFCKYYKFTYFGHYSGIMFQSKTLLLYVQMELGCKTLKQWITERNDKMKPGCNSEASSFNPL